MTTNSENTKNKLLDSMRLSKEGAGETPAASKPAASKAAAAPKKAAKKAAPKKKAAASKPAAAAPTGSYSAAEGRAKVPSDAFESGRRIWPD